MSHCSSFRATSSKYDSAKLDSTPKQSRIKWKSWLLPSAHEELKAKNVRIKHWRNINFFKNKQKELNSQKKELVKLNCSSKTWIKSFCQKKHRIKHYQPNLLLYVEFRQKWTLFEEAYLKSWTSSDFLGNYEGNKDKMQESSEQIVP